MLDLTSETEGIRAKAARDSLTIYGEVRDAIVNGAFPAGSRLPTERELAVRFQAARNTVRRTMGKLADEGLIIRHVGRGTFVADDVRAAQAPAQEYSLSELLEARLLFEPHLPDLVVERATAADIAAMEASLVAMRQAESWSDFKEAKYALHLSIAHASHNRFIVSIFEQIVASRRRAGWDRPGGHPVPLSAVREAAFQENADIVEALKSRDAKAAGDAVRTYLVRTLSVAGST